MNSGRKSWFYCIRFRWLKVEARASSGLQPEQAMRNPKPFIVIQNGKPIFTVYAYSLDQARAHRRGQGRGRDHRRRRHAATHRPSHSTERPDDPRHQERPSRNGLRLSACRRRSGAALSAKRWNSPSSCMHTPQSLPHDGLQPPRSHLPRRPRHARGAACVVPFVAASRRASEER